jgi:thiol-disulfide isomerase/thioredoxin
MKKFPFAILIALITATAMAQTPKITRANINEPAYKRFPTVPPFKLLMLDSSSYFTKENLRKNHPVMIVIFNPTCEHCQHETESLINNIEKFKDIEIVMSTPEAFEKMKDFNTRYGLHRFKNIIIGQDERFMLPSFYVIHNLPYLAFYDKKQQLISVHEGTMPVEEILKEFGK